MAKNNQGKSSAELYRQERKARIAQANKKKTKLSPKSTKLRKIVKATTAIVVVLALVIGIGTYGFFNSGYSQKLNKVLTIGNHSYTEVEYSYEYLSLYSMISNQCLSIDQQYGPGTAASVYGYDFLKTPETQEYKGTDIELEEGETITWADYFDMLTKEKLQKTKVLLDEAAKVGLELDEEEINKINEDIESIRGDAAEKNITINQFLKLNYGKGINEKTFRNLIKNATLAEKYSSHKQKELEASYSDKTIEEWYEENSLDYDVANLRVFIIDADVPTASEDKTEEENAVAKEEAIKSAKSKAQAMLNEITDAGSFINAAIKYANDDEEKGYLEEDNYTLIQNADYSMVESNFGEEIANWSFDNSRQKNDKASFEVEDGFCIILVVDPRYRDNDNQPIDVRHILIQFDDESEEGEEETEDIDPQEAKAQKLAEAQEILDTWKSGEATEESFSALAQEKSDDTGSAQSGGIIQEIYKDSNYVQPFKDWTYEEGRKVGDTGIVETTYGYHIMYCSNISDKPAWKLYSVEDMVYEDFNNYIEEVLESDDYKITINEKKTAKAKKNLLSFILKVVTQLQASEAASNIPGYPFTMDE